MTNSFQDKDQLLSELNSELIVAKEELKQTSHSNQVNEKRYLKSQEDLECCQKKIQSFKDIEKVYFIIK